jgi:hypothetical protein
VDFLTLSNGFHVFSQKQPIAYCAACSDPLLLRAVLSWVMTQVVTHPFNYFCIFIRQDHKMIWSDSEAGSSRRLMLLSHAIAFSAPAPTSVRNSGFRMSVPLRFAAHTGFHVLTSTVNKPCNLHGFLDHFQAKIITDGHSFVHVLMFLSTYHATHPPTHNIGGRITCS